jgi:hypothetical protein
MELSNRQKKRQKKQRKIEERKAATARRRFAKTSPNAKWRNQPASEHQWLVLKKLGRSTGACFPENITKGEASDVISAHIAADPSAARWRRRGVRKRPAPATTPDRTPSQRESTDDTAKVMRSWRFGRGQSHEQELGEIRRAARLGLSETYAAAALAAGAPTWEGRPNHWEEVLVDACEILANAHDGARSPA